MKKVFLMGLVTAPPTNVAGGVALAVGVVQERGEQQVLERARVIARGSVAVSTFRAAGRTMSIVECPSAFWRANVCGSRNASVSRLSSTTIACMPSGVKYML